MKTFRQFLLSGFRSEYKSFKTPGLRFRLFLSSFINVVLITQLVTGSFTFTFDGPSNINNAAYSKNTSQDFNESFGKLPLSFVSNEGQLDDQVKFLSQGNGYSFFLTAQEAILSLNKSRTGPDQDKIEPGKDSYNENDKFTQSLTSTIRFKMLGANPQPEIQGLGELPGKSNYLMGNNAAGWSTGLKNYSQVLYRNVYQGIDQIYYGNQRQLEYDFKIYPGAKPGSIKFSIDGVDGVSINKQGDLVLQTPGGELIQRNPEIYQVINGARKNISGQYLLKGNPDSSTPLVSFDVPNYDFNYPLVIDPVLVYSSYLGGSGEDTAFGVAVNNAGEAYITGYTQSPNFPSKNPLAGASGGADIFVMKLNAAGDTILYSTYLGGSGNDFSQRMALDNSGNVYLTGDTNSPNFPTANAFQPKLAGNKDAFVSKLNPAGNSLIYSTYLGGSNSDSGNQIAVDGGGNAFITGTTASNDFPTLNPFQSSLKGGVDAFVTKLDNNGAKVYSTFLGGTGEDRGFSIALDGDDNAYITGATSSTSNDFPTTTGVIKPQFSGGLNDAFVSKLNAAGNSLVYSTYLGGAGEDFGFGIAVDGSRNAYITGLTNSGNFPLVNPFQSNFGGIYDAFVSKLNATGTNLVYSTFLGGSDYDQANGIALDSNANAYITGSTYSSNFPVGESVQPGFGGNSDGFAAKLNAAGNTLIYSTFLGGNNNDAGNWIAVDNNGNAYVVGSTNSNNFPSHNALQTSIGGNNADAFIVKLSNQDGGAKITPSPSSCQTFAETGFAVCGRFLEYWKANGGLAQQGFPISGVFEEQNQPPPAGDGKIHRVQYFQRARFEEHLENQPPYDVLLGLLGTEQFKTKYSVSPVTIQQSGSCQTFAETGFAVCGRFLEYWKANGGLAQQGFPISGVFEEQNQPPPAGDGKIHRVQYFQRARFEEHLENQPPYDVLLGLLGAEQYKRK